MKILLQDTFLIGICKQDLYKYLIFKFNKLIFSTAKFLMILFRERIPHNYIELCY